MHLGGKVPTIANERRRFNSLYSTEPDVIVIIRKEVEVTSKSTFPKIYFATGMISPSLEEKTVMQGMVAGKRNRENPRQI